jgi:hypothetical protein
MSKKKFSSGLDELFAELAENPAVSEVTLQTGTTRSGRNLKSFTSDLEAVMNTDLSDDANASSDKSSAPNPKSKSRQASLSGMPSGLDALIRQTIDIQDLEKEEQRGIRRLTVAVDREKLDKLKAIARMENAYLKDLLLELIDDYINEYADQKGLPL